MRLTPSVLLVDGDFAFGLLIQERAKGWTAVSSAWKTANPQPALLAQQWMRFPYVYKGLTLGGLGGAMRIPGQVQALSPSDQAYLSVLQSQQSQEPKK